ncbi:MAG TPA: M14 family metallocarboxypeptidase [Roseimicrobium sp.]|nr:M14 family metallocarboxypeptidase [Roseimicrobium sp.]
MTHSHQRLGINRDGYHGETIDIDAVLAEVESLGRTKGWSIEVFGQGSDWRLTAMRLVTGDGDRRIYISAGIHGDEPAGPLAVRQLVQDHEWPEGVEIWLLPCLNPAGFRINRRENPSGVDLNRDYLGTVSEEVRSHIEWLKTAPQFGVAFCLHEDWESHGFYLYELDLDGRGSVAQVILNAVREVCPIDLSPEIEGRVAHGGLVVPPADPLSRPLWPEAFYLVQHKTRLSYTLEAPSDFALPVRVASLVSGIKAAVRTWAEQR